MSDRKPSAQDMNQSHWSFVAEVEEGKRAEFFIWTAPLLRDDNELEFHYQFEA